MRDRLLCGHGLEYACPRCGRCLPHCHKLIRPYWQCKDLTLVRTDFAGRRVEEIPSECKPVFNPSE